MRRIFISYRREDSAPQAGRLADRLRSEFGPDSVFLDIDAIDPGQHFPSAIESALESSDVALVLIGPEWQRAGELESETPGASDWVRFEVAAALRRNAVRVIPVLLEGARMPTPDELPADLKPLADRNAFHLTSARWNIEARELTDTVRRTLNPAPTPPPPASKTRPRRPRWLIPAITAAALLLATATAILLTGNDDKTPAKHTVTTKASAHQGTPMDSEETTTEIRSLLYRFHQSLRTGDYSKAWKLLSVRKRASAGAPSQGGYATWVRNQKTVGDRVDPNHLDVRVLDYDKQSQVATVDVSLGWTGSGCSNFDGITWVKHENGAWYYDPGYSTTPQRRAEWKPQIEALLGSGCV